MSGRESALREAVCRTGHSLFARGLVHGSAGNISVRLDDGFLITPTDASLGDLDPARLARTDADGRQTAGDRASKTLALHRAIYAADPEARCVIHTHSTPLVALSLARAAGRVPTLAGDDFLAPITPYFVMKVGHVPLLPYRRPGDPQTADLVARAIADARDRGAPIRAVMLDRLGPNVWHGSPAEAMAVLEELVETARLVLQVPDAPPLDDAAIEQLRQAFGARW